MGRRRNAGLWSLGTCPDCQKQRYPNRKAARKAARILHPGEHYNEYECTGGYWHYGHLSKHLIDRGHQARGDLYRAARRRPKG